MRDLDAKLEASEGDRVRLTFTIKDGKAPYTFQWTKAGAKYSGPVNTSGDTSYITPSDDFATVAEMGGDYQCKVKDSDGVVVESTVCAVTVYPKLDFKVKLPATMNMAADITKFPQDFSVAVVGGKPPLKFAWDVDGTVSSMTSTAGKILIGESAVGTIKKVNVKVTDAFFKTISGRCTVTVV